MFIYFFNLQYILIQLLIIEAFSPIKVLDKGILPLEKNSIAMQFFVDLENIDKMSSCKVNSWSTACCLMDDENADCDSIKLLGEYFVVVRPKDRHTLLYVYPTMAQSNLVGYCTIAIDSYCGFRSKRQSKENIKISFDTRLNRKRNQHYLKRYVAGQKIAHCQSIDRDPLNQCEPVNCDLKYSGTKPFYSEQLKRCVKIPECMSDLNRTLPNIVFEPRSRTCRDLDHSLTLADIYGISSGLGVVDKGNESEENLKLILKSNCTTISQHLLFLRDVLYGNLCPTEKGYTFDFKNACNNAILSIIACIIGLSVGVLMFVCCINTVANVHQKRITDDVKRKIMKIGSRIDTDDVDNCDESCSTTSRVDNNVRNKLLRDVIVSDLPLELRDSVVDICERMGKKVKWKRRYRLMDVGSQINLKEATSDTSTTSELDNSEKEKLTH